MEDHDSDARARLVARIDAVRARFIENLGARTGELAVLARLAGEDAEQRPPLRLGLHNLAGASPTLGLPVLGRKAAQLEARLMSAPAGRLDPDFAEQLAGDITRLAHEPD